MSSKKTRLQIVSRRPEKAVKEMGSGGRGQSRPAPARGLAHIPGPPRVSGRWLLSAVALSIAGAALCAWGVLCLLFWQGSWQLLYHPAAAVAHTPASAGMAFEPVEFAATDTGVPRLKGWWIPAAAGAPLKRFTVVTLHGQNGNMGDTVDALAGLHASGVNILAFDYRGYGQSQFARPSEAHWREDADWAIEYLTGTRHIDPDSIVLDGTGLGANLALEVAATHPELAGVVLHAPIAAPMNAVFGDARARMVPAHLLVRDRYDLNEAAAALRVPVLWFEWTAQAGQGGAQAEPAAYRKITSNKMLVWLSESGDPDKQTQDALSRWFDGLQVR